jgi:hypothetical protein
MQSLRRHFPRTSVSLAWLVSLALAPWAAAQGRVWSVDAAGGADFVEVAHAVAAAADGDVVFVRPGTYAVPVVWADKGLTIVGDGPGVQLLGRLQVSTTASSQAVALADLELVAGVEVRQCSGLVHLQGILGPYPSAPGPIPPGLSWNHFGICGIGGTRHTIEGSPRVTLVACELFGADGGFEWPDGGPGEHGLVVRNSMVAIHGGQLVGGRGADADPNYSHGAQSGAGGDGLYVVGAAAFVYHSALSAAGGAAGTVSSSGCPGLPIREAQSGSAQAATHPSVDFSCPAVFRGGERPLVSVTATPGVAVFVLAAPTGEWTALGSGTGVLAVGAPRRTLPFGLVPASGVLTFALGHPGPALLTGSVELHYQALVVEPTRRYLSAPRQVTVVHSSL